MTSKKELKALVAKRESQIMIAKQAIEEYKKAHEEDDILRTKIATRVAAIEYGNRADKIANVIRGIFKEEDMNRAIESFTRSALPFEEIDWIVTTLRKRSTK